jgi:hypothetical protein
MRGLRNLPLEWIVVHELGHAVGVTHHADDVREWRDVPGRLNVSAGTGINDLSGHMNHAGDAGRNKASADFIVVNDVAAPDPRP